MSRTAPLARFALASVLTSASLIAAAIPEAHAQSAGAAPPHAASSAPAWIVPQVGRAIGRPAIEVTQVAAQCDIRGRVATTTLDIAVVNRSGRPEQAMLLVPVPSDAIVTGFAFEGPASEPTAKLLPKDEARRIYDQIVARERDPALLEWAGWNLLRSSVFPVPAGGTQRMRISWENLLIGSGDRLDYTLPRSDLVGGAPWTIEVTIHGRDVAAAYSPSHEILTERPLGAGGAPGESLRVRANARAAGSFRLSIVRTSTPSVSVMTYPDPASGGGFFLLLAAAPDAAGTLELSREVTIVLDRSGSLSGAPFERAKAAVLRVLDDLGPADRANVIDFSNSVAKFDAASTALDAAARSRLREYVASLRSGGGTNIHDALLEGLRQPRPADGIVSTILFVTDGVPTIGRTSERDIRALVEQGNAASRRIFAIGLGNDLNAPMLDRIADMTRANATYLAMDDDLPAKIGEVAARLRGPMLAELSLQATDQGRIADLQPSRLPDLFRAGTLVVLGHYRGEAPFTLSLEGRGTGGMQRLAVEVDPRQASTANAFVPRLWASRRIAQLVDEVRQLGLDGATVNWSDPRMRELVGEIVRLSTTWGVLTEYTSMLALEGSNLGDLRALERACTDALQHRAVQQRVGAAAVSQSENFNRQKWDGNVAASRQFVAPGGAQVEASAMNQCADRTFYKSGPAWADASLAGRELRVDEEIAWGSDRHRELLWELVDEGRQSAIAMEGEILILHRGRTLLVRNDAAMP